MKDKAATKVDAAGEKEKLRALAERAHANFRNLCKRAAEVRPKRSASKPNEDTPDSAKAQPSPSRLKGLARKARHNLEHFYDPSVETKTPDAPFESVEVENNQNAEVSPTITEDVAADDKLFKLDESDFIIEDTSSAEALREAEDEDK